MAKKRMAVRGKEYRLQVFMIHTKDAKGRPALCKMIPDEHEIDLAGGEEFFTAYVPAVMLDKE